VIAPERREGLACRAQPLDQRAQGRIVGVASGVGAQLGDEAARAIVPIGDEGARRAVEKDIIEQAGFAAPQPVGEQPRGGRVPGARAPQAIKKIGGRGDRVHSVAQNLRGSAFFVQPSRQLRGIALARELKQIGPLGRRQLHGVGQPRQSRRGDGNVAPLLDPGVPGRAHAADLRHFLAAKPRRSPPLRTACTQPDVGGAQLLAPSAKESTDQAPLITGQQHGETIYTRITCRLVTG